MHNRHRSLRSRAIPQPRLLFLVLGVTLEGSLGVAHSVVFRRCFALFSFEILQPFSSGDMNDVVTDCSAVLLSSWACCFIPSSSLRSWPNRRRPFAPMQTCTETRQTSKSICDYIVKEKSTFPTIYVGGYYMRDLVAGYEIFGGPPLSRHRHWPTATILLSKQMPNAFGATGYGPIYLADTGSALGCSSFSTSMWTRASEKNTVTPFQRYTNSLQHDGMILPSGAFGNWVQQIKNGVADRPDPRSIHHSPSALTGATIFTWMYHQTKAGQISRNFLSRLEVGFFPPCASDGNIPYILAEEGADWAKRGDPKNDYQLWTDSTYGTSALRGRRRDLFDLYCDNPAWKPGSQNRQSRILNFYCARSFLTEPGRSSVKKLGPHPQPRHHSTT